MFFLFLFLPLLPSDTTTLLAAGVVPTVWDGWFTSHREGGAGLLYVGGGVVALHGRDDVVMVAQMTSVW